MNAFKRIIKKHYMISATFLFLALSLLIVLPYLYGRPIANIYDLQFHLTRLQETFLNMKNGDILNLVPDVSTMTFGSIVYPQNLFYPVYTLIPEALIHLLIGNAWISYILFISLVNFLIFMSMFVTTLKITESKVAALFSALLYGFTQFELTYMFVKQDIAQAMALIFVPVIFYGAYLIFVGNYRRWYILSIGMTLLIFTHIISVFMVTIFIVLLFGLLIINKLTKREVFVRTSYFVLSGIVTILLSIFFLGPLVNNYLYAGGITVTKWNLYLSTVNIQQALFNFLPSSNGETTIGVGVSGLMSLIIIFSTFRKFNVLFKYLTGMLIVFFILSSNLFPWQIFNQKLEFIQSPWRFFLIVCYLLALISGYGLAFLLKKDSSIVATAMLVVFILVSSFTAANMYIKQDAADKPNEVKSFVTNYKFFEKFEVKSTILDYLPSKTGNQAGNLLNHSISGLNKGKNIRLSKYEITKNGVKYNAISSKNYSKIILPNIYYPGYHVQINGREIKPKINNDKLLVVPIKNGNNKVHVYYLKTNLQIVTLCISVISWIGIIIFIRVMKYRIKSDIDFIHRKIE